MDENLAAGLARALNLSPADAERAVTAIGRQLRERLDASGAVRIDGLGTFRRTGGRLAFEPAPPLAAAVNHRFAGLPAVPAPDLAGRPPAPPPPPDEDPFGSVHAGPELHLPEEEQAPPAPMRDLASPDDESSGTDADLGPAGEAGAHEPITEPAGGDEAAAEPEDAPAAEHLEEELEEPVDTWAAEDDDAWAAFPDMPLISDEDLLSQEDLDAASGDPEPEAPLADPAKQEDEAPGAPAQLHAEEASDAEPVDDFDLHPEAPAALDEPDDDAEDLDALIDGVWTPRTGPADEEHPLGPPPADMLEDADFLVLEGAAPAGPDVDERPPDAAAPDDVVLSEDPPPAMPPPAGESQPPGTTEPPPEPPAFAASRQAQPADEPRRRRRWPWIMMLVLLVGVAAAALWFLQPQRPAAPEPVAEAPPPVAEEQPATAEPPDAEEPAPAGEDAAAPTDGALRSAEAVDPAGGGFTWVISEPSQAAARQRMERYRQQGYRVAVIPATVRGATYFRVAIGQFQSRAEAEQHRGQLPPDAPTDIWILAL